MERKKRLPSDSSMSSYSSGSDSFSEALLAPCPFSGQDEDGTSSELNFSNEESSKKHAAKSRTLLDDVRVILRKHDKKLSQAEDDIAFMVRWLNEKFGFILKDASTSSISSSLNGMVRETETETGGLQPSVSVSPASVAGESRSTTKKKLMRRMSPESSDRDHDSSKHEDALLHEKEIEEFPTNDEDEVFGKVASPVNVSSPVAPLISSTSNHPTFTPIFQSTPSNAKVTSMKRRRNTKRSSKDNQVQTMLSQCDTCGKFLKDQSTLRQHKQIHLNVRPFLCSHPGCEKSFRRKFHLQTHSLIHQGIRRHQCRYCGRLFLLQKDLVSHERIHTGERPFHCSYSQCTKSFNLKSHLVMHLRTHTGEKPYKCDICFKCFTQSNSLRLHKKKLHQNTLNETQSNNSQQLKRKPNKTSSRKGKKSKPNQPLHSEPKTMLQSSPPKIPIYKYQGTLINAHSNIIPSATATLEFLSAQSLKVQEETSGGVIHVLSPALISQESQTSTTNLTGLSTEHSQRM